MANLRSIDMLVVDDLFDMHGGYVLNFSDRTFATFFAEELKIDIDEPRYSAQGSSKAKRLRYFLQMVDKATAARTLTALWEYRELMRERGQEEKVKNAHGRFLQLIAKLEGTGAKPTDITPKPAFDRAKFAELLASLMELANLAPNQRGLWRVQRTRCVQMA
jgi:hypothetical protein